MASLTRCLSKAGKLLSRDDREAILATAFSERANGADAKTAARAAIMERIISTVSGVDTERLRAAIEAALPSMSPADAKKARVLLEAMRPAELSARASEGRRYAQAGAALMERPLPVTSTGGKKGGTITVADIGRAFDGDHAQTVGRKLFPEDSEEDFQTVLQYAREEFVMQMQRPNSGVGWYSADVELAIRVAAKVFPTLLTDRSHRRLYMTFAGIFSTGTDPDQAFMMSALAFEGFLASGQIPVTRAESARMQGVEPEMTTFVEDRTGQKVTKEKGWGGRSASNEQQLAFLRWLVGNQGSLDAAMRWLLSPKSRVEINDAMVASGAFKEPRWTTKKEREGSDEYGLLVFGEKLGRYTLGLHGLAEDEGDTTVDLWYTRSYRRWTGRLFDAPIGKEGIAAQPNSPQERQALFRLTGELSREFGVPIGDVQAVLWFWEKRLWGAHGLSIKEGTNSSGALKLASARGINVDPDPILSDIRGGIEPPSAVGDQQVGQRGASGRTLFQSGVARGAGSYALGDLAPLPGAPRVEGASGPDPRLVAVAEGYARDYGLDLRRQAEFVEVDPERAARIADAYAQMPHAPSDPAVKTAYAELIRQTVAQYRALEAAGYRFWFFDETNDPYAGNPWNAMRDLRANQSMAVFATEAGFGSGATDLNVDDNPMLADTGIEWPYGAPDGPMKRVLANDLFRAVHDAFGHGIEGAGFRARGEENAWQAHVRLFYGPAVAAITTETRGQNSWLNYGPYGEKNRTAAVEDTVFADQKTGLMPEWTWTEGRAGDMPAPLPAGSSPALNDRGMVELTHWSSRELDTIDPAFAGTGPMRGTERRMAGPKKAYFGVNVGQSGGYRKEGSLGKIRHTVEIDPSRLYNYNEDPAGLKAGVDRSLPGEQQIGQYEDAIKAAGFAGYWVQGAPMGDAAALFEPVPVRDRVSEKRPVPPQFLKNRAKTLFQRGPTQTEAFKKWFEGSKVVDADGRPLVVYHATRSDFDAFDTGIESGDQWFGQGSYFATKAGDLELHIGRPIDDDIRVVDAYLSIKNPYVWSSGGSARVEADLQAAGIDITDPTQYSRGTLNGKEASAKFTQWAKAQGYDGVFAEPRGGGIPNEIIAFEPTQIKSVDNVGTFDPKNPSILEQNMGGPRGSIEFPPDGIGKGETVMRLFRSRDLSTVLHESGHAWLAMLQALANDQNATPEIVSMYDIVLNWWSDNAAAVARDGKSATGTEITADDVKAAIENGTTGDMEKDIAIDVGMQEQFARAIEVYFMEGKSPSKELRSTFERFRAWLLSVYRTALKLNVEVSDELRTVFDRMFATDRQIAEASKATGLEVMVAAEAEKLGILPDEYTKLRRLHAEAMEEANAKVLAETMRPIREQQRAAYREERAKVREQVTKEMQSQPVYVAIKALRFGKNVDDTEINPPIKLSREAIAQGYDRRFLTSLPGYTKDGKNHRFSVVGSEGGLAPEVVAEMFGFESGQALLEALEGAPPLKQVIDVEVERIMYERYGDPLIDGTVEEMALEEMHGEKQARYLEEELRLLTRPAGKSARSNLASEVKAVARQTINRMLVKDATKPNKFLAAERRSSADALKAIAAGDREAAVVAKRKQLINHHLYSEAMKVQREIDRLRKRVAKSLNRSDEKASKSRDVDYVKAARAIAARFELASPDSDFDFQMWLEQLKFDDPLAHDAIYQAIDAYGQDAKPYTQLSVERMRGVIAAIDSIMEVGKTAKQIEIDGKKMEREQALTELKEIAEKRQRANPLVKDSIKVRLLTMAAGIRRVGDWARDMDDGALGPFTRYLVKPIMEAVGAYKVDRADKLQKMLDIINARKGELFGAPINAREIGHTFANKGELLHAILHTGNESNKRKLLLGYGWAYEQPPGVDGRKELNTSRWDAFVRRAFVEGILTKEDMDMAQAIWDLLETTKRPAQATHKRIYGFYFDEIEAAPIKTPFGDYRGGYVPATVDKFLTREGDLRVGEALDQMPATAMFPTTGSGFTKSRVENYSAKLELNLMLLPAHLDKVLKFTHIEPIIRQTGSLLRDRELADMLGKQNPAILNSMLFPWLQRVAQQAVEAPPQSDAGRSVARFFRAVRSRVGISTMFANLVNAVQQVTGFSTAAVLVPPGRLKTAMVRFMHDGAAMREEMIKASPFMADRTTNHSREILNRIEDAVVKPTTIAEMQQWFMKHGYFLQQGIQNLMDPIVWHAAYTNAIERGAPHSDAVFEADQVVQRSQSDNSPETLSTFETGPAFQRVFTMFYSYFGAQLNMLQTEVSTTLRTLGWGGKKRFAWIYLTGMMIPAVVAEMIVQGMRGGLDDDEEDGYEDELASMFFMSQLRYTLASIPVAGQVSNVLIGSFTDEFYDDRLATSPVITTVERAARAPSSIVKAVEDGDKTPRAIGDTLTLLGLILGVPVGQLAKTTGYVGNVMTDRANPETPVDIVQGVVSGRDGTER